jgi:hypothetical protein
MMYFNAKFHMPTCLVQCHIIYLHHNKTYTCTFHAAAILFYIPQQYLTAAAYLTPYYKNTSYEISSRYDGSLEMRNIQNVSLQILSKEFVKEMNDNIGFFKALPKSKPNQQYLSTRR